MAKYNQQKIFDELDKLTPEEVYVEFQKIKDYSHRRLTEYQKLIEEKANDLQSKADSLK